MHKADGDLKDSTRYTSLWEADKHEHQLMDDNEAEACEDADCWKQMQEQKEPESMNY